MGRGVEKGHWSALGNSEQRSLLASDRVQNRLNIMHALFKREVMGAPIRHAGCQSTFKFDPVSASNFDPFGRRVLAVALVPSELAGVAETA